MREHYPGGNKVFHSELMVAYVYCRIGSIERARQKFLQISRDFPNERYQSDIATLSEKIRSVKAQEMETGDKERDTIGRSSDGSDGSA